jgi:alkylation response protein AidB-like acyl-CoA dehydrogenase
VLAAGRIALAFDLLGCCERALELALAYAGERKQFGRVIGSFRP